MKPQPNPESPVATVLKVVALTVVCCATSGCFAVLTPARSTYLAPAHGCGQVMARELPTITNHWRNTRHAIRDAGHY